MQPKTIITYLVDGNPTGIKTMELSNWIGKAIIIPRSKLKEAKDRLETKQPSIYFLFGDNEEDGSKKAYIGEAENLINRLSSHDLNKEFWTVVIAFISKDNNLTKADVKFLEANAIQRVLKSDRVSLDNNAEPILNNLPEYQKATMLEFMDYIDLLLSTAGYPIFREITLKTETEKGHQIYYYKDSNKNRGTCDAKGIYTEEGFLILRGSIGPKQLQEHVIKNKGTAYRNRPILLQEGIIVEQGDSIIFQQDYLFSSPSAALSIITGASVNGWIIRKDEHGNTLDENIRKNLSSN